MATIRKEGKMTRNSREQNPIMASSDARIARLNILLEWARVGAGKRPDFPVEAKLMERIKNFQGPLFKPVAMPPSDDIEYHREASFLLEGIDQFPRHVDLTFDFIWRAFDNSFPKPNNRRPDMTKNLVTFCQQFGADNASDDMESFIDIIAQGFPQQAGEYLVSKWLDDDADGQLIGRLHTSRKVEESRSNFSTIRGAIRKKYELSCDKDQPSEKDITKVARDRRNAARLIGIMLRNENFSIDGTKYSLSAEEKAVLVISGLLYSFRNSRVHGNIPAPFTSSVASLRTYTLPHYAFVVTYSAYLSRRLSLMRKSPVLCEGDQNLYVHDLRGVLDNLNLNLELAKKFYGKEWS